MKKYHKLSATICICGIILSCYTYHVEKSKEENEDYTAMCDINEHISCTKAFSSVYGRGFGLLRHVVGEHSIINQPNGLFGIIFYIIYLVLDQQSSNYVVKLQLAMCILSNLASVYLAYILTFILHDFCVVCVTTYILNAILFYCYLKKSTLLTSHVSSAAKGYQKKSKPATKHN